VDKLGFAFPHTHRYTLTHTQQPEKPQTKIEFSVRGSNSKTRAWKRGAFPGAVGENDRRGVKVSKANATRALLVLPVIVAFVVSRLAYNKIRTNDNKEVQIKSQLELTAKWKRPQNYNHNDVGEGAGASWELGTGNVAKGGCPPPPENRSCR